MAFLLNSHAQSESGKNEQSTQTPRRRAPEARGPMQLHRLHRLKTGPACSELFRKSRCFFWQTNWCRLFLYGITHVVASIFHWACTAFEETVESLCHRCDFFKRIKLRHYLTFANKRKQTHLQAARSAIQPFFCPSTQKLHRLFLAFVASTCRIESKKCLAPDNCVIQERRFNQSGPCLVMR